MRKLQPLSNQMKDNILTHMPTLKEAKTPDDRLQKYSTMLEVQYAEFSRLFQDVRTLEGEMFMIFSPLNCSMDDAPSEYQMELIDLQSSHTFGKNFKSVSLMDFYSSLK